MIGLFRAEVLRLTSRRAVRLMGLAAIALILVVQGVAFAKSSKDVEGAARRHAAAAERQAREERPRAVADCRLQQQKNPSAFPEGFDCEQIVTSSGGFEEESPDPRYDAARLLPDVAKSVVGGLAIVGFIVGASSIGAEWGAGTMQALLFWEPRRMRVVLAKAAALVVVLLGFLLVAELVGMTTTVLNGALRGTTDGLTGGRWMSTFLAVGRGAGLVTFTGLLGFAITGLTRVTTAALGAAFAYFVILENILRVQRPGWERFLISPNCAALLNKTFEVAGANVRHRTTEFGRGLYTLTAGRAAVTLGLYLVLLVGAFVVAFRRRDVT